MNPETILFELIKNYDRDNIKTYFKVVAKEHQSFGFFYLYN